MTFELTCCTQTLLGEIANEKLNQEDIATTYALALSSSEKTNWETVNRAIIRRWSISDLIRIENLAWSKKQR